MAAKSKNAAQLKKIVEAGRKAQQALNKLEEAMERAKFTKLIGKAFKYRNSYGHGESWWLYALITSVDGYFPKCIQFQKDCDGKTTIEIDHVMGPQPFEGSGWETIELEEFSRAWDDVRNVMANTMAANLEWASGGKL